MSGRGRRANCRRWRERAFMTPRSVACQAGSEESRAECLELRAGWTARGAVYRTNSRITWFLALDSPLWALDCFVTAKHSFLRFGSRTRHSYSPRADHLRPAGLRSFEECRRPLAAGVSAATSDEESVRLTARIAKPSFGHEHPSSEADTLADVAARTAGDSALPASLEACYTGMEAYDSEEDS